MKKLIAFILVFTLGFGAVANVNALNNSNNSVMYSYSYRDYETTILNSTNNDYICFEIVENGEKIKLEYDKDFRYVKVNDNYYDYDDFNNAMLLQSTYIYDKNQPITIVEALNGFSKIDNINAFKNTDSSKIAVENNENSVVPTAEYGKFYYVGSRKKSLLVSLASSAISTIIAFLVTGAAGLAVAQANIVAFVSGVLASEGVSYFTSDVYYKIYQAILNVHNTTREKRILGIYQPFKAQVVWDTAHPYYRTFETQRPNY